MKSEFQRINEDRPGKILKLLATIQTSAKSNKASDAEIAELLAPVRDALGLAPVATAPAPSMSQPPSKYPKGSARQILDGLTPSQKFDLIYAALIDLDQDLFEGTIKSKSEKDARHAET